MTIDILKAKIAAYLQRAVLDLSVNGVDLILDAINTAQQGAFQQYDFERAKASVTIPVSSDRGAHLGNATLYSPPAESPPVVLVTIKKIVNAWLQASNGTLTPLRFTTQRNEFALRSLIAPVQPILDTTWPGPYLVQVGTQLYLYNNNGTVLTNPQTVLADCILMLPEYVNNSSTDFMLVFGDDFLFWSALVQLNYYTKEYVERTEGSLPSPKDMVKASWQNLLDWDAQLTSVGNTELSLD